MTKPQFRSKSGGSAISLIETLNDETPEQRHAAALAICDRATDVDDARRLLQALGLVSDVGHAKHWHRGGPSGRIPVVREGSL